MVTLRIRTLPMQQWIVGRAFNRLVKIAFDERRVVTRDPSPIRFTDAMPAADREPRPAAAPERRRA